MHDLSKLDYVYGQSGLIYLYYMEHLLQWSMEERISNGLKNWFLNVKYKLQVDYNNLYFGVNFSFKLTETCTKIGLWGTDLQSVQWASFMK